MKYASLAAAAAIVVIASAFALLHAAANRSGTPDAQITLTDRELKYYRDSDDSGVTLLLSWVDTTAQFGLSYEDLEDAPWLNQNALASIGFDCSVAPGARNADRFYGRQQPRRGYVALEYDGPAWQAWLDLRRRISERQPQVSFADQDRNSSRLVTIDAAGNPSALRARHPNRGQVVILPAVFSIYLSPRIPPGQGRTERPARLTGMIQQIPYWVHVSRPLSERFQHLARATRDARQEQPLYRVQLTFGSLLEPWVTGAEVPGR